MDLGVWLKLLATFSQAAVNEQKLYYILVIPQRKGLLRIVVHYILNMSDLNGNTPLHWAVEKNQVESVKMLLDNGADPNILNRYQLSPLHGAVQMFHNEIVKVLAGHKGIDLNLEGELGNTPLLTACCRNNHEGINILINQGAIICCQNRLGNYSIHVAAFMGSTRAMEVLLRRGQDIGISIEKHINYLNKGLNSPLHIAVRSGSVEAIKYCIECGVKIDLAQADKSTAIHLASAQGITEAVMLMLSMYKGEKDLVNIVDGSLQTPLHKCAIFDHYELAEYLISKGAFIDCIDSKSQSPLLLAAFCGSWKVLNLLVMKGANLKIKDGCGCNFLHLAVLQQGGLKNLNDETMKNSNIKELVNDEDNEGCTPLHYACRQGVSDSVHNMLGLEVSIYTKSKDKKSPLHFAACYGRVNTCQRLLENMTDTRLLNEGDDKGMTPLHLAAQNGHIRVVQLLLRKGALFFCDYKCWTSLHYAAVGGFTQTMQILLDADMTLIDKTEEEGNTALHLAAQEGYTGAVSLLLENGAAITLNKKNASYFHLAIRNQRKEVVHAVIQSKRVYESVVAFHHRSEYGCGALEMIEHLPEGYMVIEYDFTYLQSPMMLKKATKEDKNLHYEPLIAVNAMARFNRIELLSHPVCREYLNMKWLAYGLIAHIFNLMTYSAMLVPLTVLIWTLNPQDYIQYTVNMSRVPSWNETTYGQRTSKEHNWWKLFLFIMAIFGICKELLQIFQQRMKYFYHSSNLLDWIICVFSIIFVIPEYLPYRMEKQWEYAAVAVLFSWINFLLYLQRFESFGIYVVMFWEIQKTMERIVFVFIFLFIAFALSFYALLNNQTTYSSPSLSLMQTFAMMLGDISYKDSFLAPLIENRLPYPALTFTVLILFMFLVPILLMNLLIGLAVGDIAEVRRNASIKRMTMQVNLHTDLEMKMPYWFLSRVDKKSIKVYPNRKRYSDPLQYFLHLLVSTCSNNSFSSSSGSSSSALELEVQKQKYRLKDILTILRKQHDLLKLIIQKMEIVTEAEDEDGDDLFQTRRLNKQSSVHKSSKWDSVIRRIKSIK
ncbi:transient receptor potential cation channel subfamily A member 1-like [Protopterus annectens]|uniref:transient receptor potential cation channel subfamily A member 1-like n=1 Tax=Protopterus annectens TaxID=7888 RepID=UPI001CFBE164|nr:transient receptor potential cation channel subfamily A member 1-like [Protopterus annectens]